MKILLFHQHYLLPGAGGGSRFNEMARMWTEAGHRVTVVAGTADYSSGAIPERYRGRWLTREADGAVEVVRCFTPAGYALSYLRRMVSFAGYTLSAATAALGQRDADVVIATSPPLLTPLPAWIAARLRQRPAPLLFEVRDLWPESAVTTGVLRERSLLTRALYALERWACSTADCIPVLTPAFREDLARRGLAPESKMVLLPNGAEDAFRPDAPGQREARERLGWGDRIVFLYAGAHGRANALGQLVDAAALLADRDDILIACAGEGPQRAALEAQARGLRNIVFHGPQPKAAMPAITAAADASLAVLQDNPTFRTVYPNKVFDAMACARPVLLAIDGAARELVVTQAQAGVFVPPERPEELAAAMRKLAGDPAARAQLGESGRAWVTANATRASVAARYLELLQRLPRRTQRGLADVAKTLFDRITALLGLLALSPVLALVALLVRLADGAPVLFTQPRTGRFGRIFRIYKFRTMSDGQRVTRLGALLRRASLDELPQLWNVLRGDLSLVGPRPLLVQYLPRYSPRQALRHLVRPGITGWAQVNGRNALDWPAKLELDAWYVEHWSTWLDLKILWRTAGQVLRGAGTAEMPEFMGNDQ